MADAQRAVWLRIKLAFLTAVSEIGERWPKFTWYQKLAIVVIGLYPTPGPGGLWTTVGQLLGAFVLVYLVVLLTRSDD